MSATGPGNPGDHSDRESVMTGAEGYRELGEGSDPALEDKEAGPEARVVYDGAVEVTTRAKHDLEDRAGRANPDGHTTTYTNLGNQVVERGDHPDGGRVAAPENGAKDGTVVIEVWSERYVEPNVMRHTGDKIEVGPTGMHGRREQVEYTLNDDGVVISETPRTETPLTVEEASRLAREELDRMDQAVKEQAEKEARR